MKKQSNKQQRKSYKGNFLKLSSILQILWTCWLKFPKIFYSTDLLLQKLHKLKALAANAILNLCNLIKWMIKPTVSLQLVWSSSTCYRDHLSFFSEIQRRFSLLWQIQQSIFQFPTFHVTFPCLLLNSHMNPSCTEIAWLITCTYDFGIQTFCYCRKQVF